MAEDRIRYRVHYRGHVQGVGFRMTSVSQSRGLSVHGFVRNEPDGSVLMDVEGAPKDVKELMRRIDVAMSGNIDDTQLESRSPRGVSSGFQIQH